MKAQEHKPSGKKTNGPLFSKNENGSGFFGVLAKLNIGKPGDQYELEADRVADQVVQASNENQGFFGSSGFFGQPRQSNTIAEKPLAEKISPFVRRQEEEEEQLQMKPVRMQDEEEEELQMQPLEEEEPVRASRETGPADVASLERNLNSNSSGGSKMDLKTRTEMESAFGTDFNPVKIHTGNHAVQMNRQIGAQAFAHGSNIYFNTGKYNPESRQGKHLLAHELAHTVQQGASVQPKLIQREGDETNSENELEPPEGVTPVSEENGQFTFSEGNLTTFFENPSGSVLRLPTISISNFKDRNSSLFLPPFQIPAGRNTNQVENWKTAVNDQVTRKLNGKISEATASGGYSREQSQENRNYFFKGKQNPEMTIFGTREQLLELSKIPIWDEENNATTFQVDHIVEHQLGGSDDVNNYELLEASANSSSGSSIAWEMNRRIKDAYDILKSDYYQSREENPALPPQPARANQYVNLFLNQGYSVSFLSNDFELETQSGMPERFWSFNDISQGKHLNKLESLTGDEMREMGTEDDPALFISPTGGNRLPVPEGDAYPVNNWLPRLNLLSRPDFVNLTLQVEAYKSGENPDKLSASYPNMTWILNRVPDAYIFYVNKDQTIQNALGGSGGVFQSLRLPGMSPIQIVSLDITENGFRGTGKVLPTVPLIGDADIDIVVDGDGVRLRKLFTAEEFNFPSPFEVENATLEVSFGTEGLGIEGQVNFGINQVGEGHIGAAASTSGGFELEGTFNFDSELFDPAEINVEYRDNTWTIGGEIGIPEGKVRGIKNAAITASYSENNFTATGEAELDIPGIERGTLNVNYGEEVFSIGGNFDLSSDIPGIQGGNVEAEVSKTEGEEGYNVSVSGTAQPDIPGLDTELSVTYENGAITIEGSASYERGMLSGNVEVGATNRTINEDGQPAGEPDDTMRVYGGGDLTLQLTPWLEAEAGVRFEPNGELVVSGHIGLPDTVEVFPRREIRRNLFTVPTIEIPLFAIPLGPRSIGLVAQIGGGLDFSAGFGPGELRELSADVTYNPDREEDTVVHGRGEFAIPADAGLTLRGDLGLGVSIAIASLSGGIELAGTLGLEGEAAAEVDVNWTPQEGITLDAEGRITVNPQFTFDINAFARASLGIGWFSISETWRHNLVSYSWGPGIEFGIVFPVHYAEGEPFDMSFDDIEVIYPDLDVIDMAKDLARDIKDDIF